MNALRYLSALALVVTLPACYVTTETSSVEPAPAPPASGGTPSIVYAIDTDAELGDIQPGVETGLYIEYTSGGLWHLYATCSDVAIYGYCHWDVVTTVHGGTFLGSAADSLESTDVLASDEVGAWIDSYTDYDTDGMYVQTTPGASLEVDALLGGAPAFDYVFWVNDGVAVLGTPSNPFELTPTAP